MAATTPRTPDDEDDPRAAQEQPVPDEDGPHDVPDDKVIEKTLPAGSGPRDGDRPRDERP